MAKPRVIIADLDVNYLSSLQLKFVNEFFEKIDLETITDEQYFEELFMKPQKADILVVSEQLYDASLQKHNISYIFVLMEQYEENRTRDLNVDRLFKYSSIKEIFNEITGIAARVLQIEAKKEKEPQIIVVTSASGGAGKTTVAMGISSCISRNYKNVLYINAARMQSFQHMLSNSTNITSSEVYIKLVNPGPEVYQDIKHTIRKEGFYYLPAFKAALISIGVDYSIYQKIALSAKKSADYDYIVIDAESTLDESKLELLDIADKVIFVTEQSRHAVYATNTFVANVNGTKTDKYIFVCNNFDRDGENALIADNMDLHFSVNDYIETIEGYDKVRLEGIVKSNGIQKISYLIL